MNPSEPMSDDNDGWIKMSERVPTEADVPYWTHGPDHNGKPMTVFCAHWYASIPLEKAKLWATHWKRAQLPAPPKPEQVEKTQQELDREAYLAFENRGAVLSLSPYIGQDRQAAWHAALAYRDAQNREDLANIGQYSSAFDTSAHVVALFNLRKRCGLP